MEDSIDMLAQFMSEEMYWSALSLAEYFYNADGCIESLVVIVEAMFHLKFYERCIEVIESNKEIQKYYTVCKIYLRSASRLHTKKNKKLIFDFENLDVDQVENPPRNPKEKLNARSILKLHGSSCTENPKKHLMASFLSDYRNFEALFLLHKNVLLTKNEHQNLVSEIKMASLSKCFEKILFGKVSPKSHVFSPITFLKMAKELYVSRNDMDIFSLGVYMINFYRESEYSYFILGLYYLLKNNYDESRKCFYKSLKINENFGEGWIGLGISYSGLKECINALECFNNAQQQMLGSSIPSLYLGFEYHKMNNLNQAEIWYKKSLKMDKNSVVVQKYSAFLISNDRYSEAMELLLYNNTDNEDRYLRNESTLQLLRCFCHLFTGNILDAQMHLDKSAQDWRYFVTSGFIKHIQSQVQDAAYEYYQALIRTKQNGVIEDLLSHSIDLIAKKAENTAFNYAADLFEALDLKSTDISFI